LSGHGRGLTKGRETGVETMQSAPKNVLIVGDDVRLCLLIGDELCRGDFDCHSVTDLQEVRQLLDTGGYDLLIAEVTGPHVTCMDLLLHACKTSHRHKVILTTGTPNHEFLTEALMLGAYECLERPFDVSELARLAREATGADALTSPLATRAAAVMTDSAQVKAAALESVQALALAVAAKDPYTRRHGEQVTHYAISLAEAFDACPDVIESVRVAAMLHDIGYVGVPDRILAKSGPLSDEEFEHVCRHPAMGAKILAAIALFEREALIVRHHHEDWDGGGYPDGLAGEEIPWAARIIRVADAMDTMLVGRAHRDPYSVDKMLGQLRLGAGKQFDPEVAAMATQWCRENTDSLISAEQPVGV
jgi:response regulator RpfG family c-di-GMP phosphodiesterase